MQNIVMKIFERIAIQNQIDHLAKIANLFAIIGAKGVGKTTLVRHWLKKNNFHKLLWINLSATISLLEKISINHKASSSLEEALEKFSQNWSQYDAIIWDDFQLLPNKQLLILIAFIKNSSSPPMHIIITDENLNTLKVEVPFLLCEPLTELETQDYLEKFLNLKPPWETTEVHKATGGLPYLLNLWSQSNRQNPMMGEAIVSLFTEEEKDLLSYLYFSQQLNTEIDLASNFEKLYQKFYIQKIEGEYRLQPYLIDVIELYFPQTIKRNAALKVLKTFEICNNDYDHFLAWIIALKSDLFEHVILEAIHIEPKHLENLTKNELKIVFQKNSMIANKINADKLSDQNARILRQFLQAGILLGERKSVLDKFMKWLPSLISEDNSTNETCWLSYELIYWLHRAEQFDIAKQLLDKLQHRASGELKYLTQLELAFPFTNSEPNRALQTLSRVTENIKSQKSSNLKVIYAHTMLQTATCYFNLENRSKSLEIYTLAEQLYQDVHQPYFAMTCRVNRLLLLINHLEISQATQLLYGLYETARKFGYNYLLSGAYYIQAIVDRENFKRSEALNNINQAIKMIPEGAPPRSSHYLLQEQISILISLGKYREAEKIYKEKLKYKASIPTRLEFTDLPFEDAQDIWTKANKSEDNTDYLRFLLLHGEVLTTLQTLHFEKSLWGRWALLENKMTQYLRSGAEQEVLLKLYREMQEVLKNVSEPIIEKIALKLLNYQLTPFSSDDDKLKSIALLRSEVLNWPADTIIKSPLSAILETLADITLQLESHLDWQTSRQLDRRRWINWIVKVNKTNLKAFVLITQKKKLEIDKWDANITDKYSLVLFEHLGMVYFQNKEIPEFHRKAVLRQLLAFIFEIFPAEISKAQMAHIVWGEAYSPSLHDARIYTSIQRLRQLLLPECIESWNGGYRWNSKLQFAYIKSVQNKTIGQHKIQTLIMQVLQNYQKSGVTWISRSELVEATQSSESTVKRELSKLLLANEIIRKGSGPSVMYALADAKS